MRISDWSSDVCSSDLRQRPKATIDRRLGVILQETKALRAAQQDVLAQSRRLLSVIQSSLADDKADDIVGIELTDKSSIADSRVIASGRSDRPGGPVAAHLTAKREQQGGPGIPADGNERSHRVLLDAGTVT